MAVIIPTDRPESVSSRCIIEVFGGVFVLSCFFLDFSVGVGVFVIGLSQISSFSLIDKGCFKMIWREKQNVKLHASLSLCALQHTL